MRTDKTLIRRAGPLGAALAAARHTTFFLLLAGTAFGQVSASAASASDQLETLRLSDNAWSVIQYPAGRDVPVRLMPTTPGAADVTALAVVRRLADHTVISVSLAAKMEMLNKKGGDFLGRRVGATDNFKLCNGSVIKIEDGRILETSEKCPRGSIIVQSDPALRDAPALHLYAVDPAGRATMLGPLRLSEDAAAQTFTTPFDKFMLVLSPDADLASLDANTRLAFRSAVPQGFAVVPFAATPGLRLPRVTQKASVTQTVGVTDVTITYSRPGVRGRKIWGDPPAGAAAGAATLDDARSRPADAVIVPYGRVWRTGANEATLFRVTEDVLINGQPLAAGSYSLHTIPGPTEWTIIFNRDDGQWGSFAYDEKKDALRVKARPEAAAELQEWLTFSIEPLADDSARVQLRWEKVNVPFTVEVRDANTVTLRKLRAAVAAAKPDDWQTPLQAANYVFANRLETDEAMRWLDQSIKARETFANLAAKARLLAAQGKTQEAIATGERALQVGRSANASTLTLESFAKSVGEWRAKQ